MAGQDDQSRRITVAVRGDGTAVVSPSTVGLPVDQHVAKVQAGWREIAGIIRKVALALDCAHEHGQLYGTLQSTDILIQGDCVVCDFSAGQQVTLSSYTAPEQFAANHPVDRLTELYRLGVVFYKLLTGREPFRAADLDTLRQQVRDDIPQPPRQLVHGLPKDLESICLRLLDKKPDQRISSGRQLAVELELVLGQFDERAKLRTHLPSGIEEKRNDLVIIQLESIGASDSPLNDLGTRPLPMSGEMQKLLHESNATPVSWDGDELLFQLVETASHDDAISRVVTLGADLLGLASRLAQQSHQRYRVRVESAEQDDSVSRVIATDCRSADLIRRVPRVVGEVSGERVQVDHASWQSLRRWVEHSESNDVAELRTLAGSELLQVHIPPPTLQEETVGPGSPLAIVKARWVQATEGLGQMVLIIGEEGTGKSRLVNEVTIFTEETEQPEVVKWTCVPGRQRCSFHPLARSLKQQFVRSVAIAEKEQSELIVEYLSGIGEMSSESIECLSNVIKSEDMLLSDASHPLSSSHKEGVCDLILKWLGHTTKDSPVLFIVEDLQWADPATLDLVTRLATNRLYEHLLLIATFRPEFETMWGSRAHQTQVGLRRLSRKYVREMLQSRLACGLVDAQVVEQAVHATGGVPMYIDAYLNRLC